MKKTIIFVNYLFKYSYGSNILNIKKIAIEINFLYYLRRPGRFSNEFKS